jgi:hypothetical protein
MVHGRAAFLVASSLALFAFAMVSCVLDAEGFTGGVPGGGNSADCGPATEEGGGSDAATGTPSPEASVEASVDHGPNLLVNEGFELGCAGWTSGQMSVSESSEARTGAKSCLLCPSVDFYPQFFQLPTQNVVTGDRYFGELWVRAPATVPSTAPPLLQLKVHYSGGSVEGPTSTGAVPSSTWTRVTALFEASHDGDRVELTVHVQEAAGECLLVDDAALYKLR